MTHITRKPASAQAKLTFTDCNDGDEEIACPRCGMYGVQPCGEPFRFLFKQGGIAIPFKCDSCGPDDKLNLRFECSSGGTMIHWELL